MPRSSNSSSFAPTWAGHSLPSDWETRPIGDVAEVFNGRATGTGGTRVRVFKTKHVYDGLVREEMPEYVPASRADSVPEKTYLRSGDVLTPNMAHGTIGRVAFVASAEPLWTVDGQVMVIRATSAAPGFLFAAMSLPQTRKALVDLEKGGAFGERRGQTHIYPRNVAEIVIPIAPLLDQEKIAEVLGTLDDSIRRTDRVVAKLKEVRQGLLHDLLTRGVDDNGELRDPDRRPEQFKDSPLGRIPKRWEVVTLREIATRAGLYGSGASALPFDPDLPRYVRITDMTSAGRLDPATRASIEWRDAEPHLLHANDLLFARSGATVGKTYLYRESDGICAHAGYVIRFQLDGAQCDAEFVFMWTQSPFFARWVQGTLRQGAQPNINATEYAGHQLPKPPAEEQAQMALRFRTLERRLLTEHEESRKLRLLKNGLMEDLLTGRVRVTPLLEAAAE